LTRSGGATTIRVRSELQVRGSAADRLEFFPLSMTAHTVSPGSTHLYAGASAVNNKPTYLSKSGLQKLRAELDEMVSVKRPEVANRIHDAKEHGDLSENAEYEDAKNEQAFVEGRIQTLEALIKNATIIDENHSTDHVQIGSTVAVESPDGKERFTIVGSAEAKPAEGRISNESPVGRALLGKKKGEKVVVKVPAGDFTYKIVGIT
jgi:transcription elongation factor GreA